MSPTTMDPVMSLTSDQTTAFRWPVSFISTPDHSSSSRLTINLAPCLQDEADRQGLSATVARVHRIPVCSTTEASRRFSEYVQASCISMIYGSNRIESAGTSLAITARLCRDVFQGAEGDVDLDESGSSYQEHLDHLLLTGRKTSRAAVVQSRKEVAYHAKALMYMIRHLVSNNEPWSEHLVLQAHAILYHGLDDDVEAGRYRNHEVAIAYGDKGKRSICMRASAVPTYMSNMIKELNNELSSAERAGHIDPYTLAARYHHQFVMIHPFGDGNGRISRIILNVLLLKYAGHVAPFGGDHDEKEEYLAIVRRGGRIFNQEDMEVGFQEQTCHREFASYVLAKSKPSLEQTWAWASCCEETETQ